MKSHTDAYDFNPRRLIETGWRSVESSYEVSPGSPLLVEIAYRWAGEGAPTTQIDDSSIEYADRGAKPVSALCEQSDDGESRLVVKYYVAQAKEKSWAEKAYPRCMRGGEWFPPDGFRPIVDSLNMEIIHSVEFEDAGMLLLLGSKNKVGYIELDPLMLEGCRNYSDIERCREWIKKSAVWKDSEFEMAEFLSEKKWRGTRWWTADKAKTKKFADESVEFMCGAKS